MERKRLLGAGMGLALGFLAGLAGCAVLDLLMRVGMDREDWRTASAGPEADRTMRPLCGKPWRSRTAGSRRRSP